MTSDLQQKNAFSSSHPSIASPCSSNGGSNNNNSISLKCSNNSSSCFQPSSGSSASSPYPWGTWEDLLLASAVSKHGVDNWPAVSCELQARAFLVPPSLFSAEACKVRFWILNGRFSSCSNGAVRDGKIPWFEEVRKLRVAQLKRELEHYDGSIGLLQKKLDRLKAETSGSEAVVTSNAREQDKPSSVAPERAASCFQVRSVGEEVSAEPSLGTTAGSLPASKLAQISCTAVSPVTNGGRELQETILVPDLKEPSRDKNGDKDLSSGNLVIDDSLDHGMHLGGIPDQHPLSCLNSDEMNGIGVHQNLYEPEVCSCNILECSVEHESTVKDGAMPFSLENRNQEVVATGVGSSDDHASDFRVNKIQQNEFGKLEDGVLAVENIHPSCSPSGFRIVVNDDVFSAEGQGPGVESTGSFCSRPGFKHSVDDNASGAEPIGCQNVSSSTVLAANKAVKECNTTEDSLLSASAMDLLRIAYADGTPVSTPDDAETLPVDSEKTVESEGSEKADCLCSVLPCELNVCEPDLFCSSVVESPHQGKTGELQSTLQNRTRGIQTNATEVCSVKESIQVKAQLFNPVFASKMEHSSEQKSCLVEGIVEPSPASSKVPDILNSGVEIAMQMADTGQLHDVGDSLVTDRICKLDCDSISSTTEIGETCSSLRPQESSVGQVEYMTEVGWVDSLEHFESCRRECINANLPCLQMAKVNPEERLGVVFAEELSQEGNNEARFKNVNLPAKVERYGFSPSKFGSSVETVGGDSTISMNELQGCSRMWACTIQSGLEQKEVSSSPAIHRQDDTVGLVEVVSRECHPKLAHGTAYRKNGQVLNTIVTQPDGRSSLVQELSEVVIKQQETIPRCTMQDSSSPDCAAKVTLKPSRFKAGRMSPEVEAESMNVKREAKPEEGSESILGNRPAEDTGLLSPLLKSKDRVDIHALEEDGLLVDLMKLKDTDLTSLRKRKYLHRGINNAERCKDSIPLNNGQGDLLVNKHPKLSRSQEEDDNRISGAAIQSKDLEKRDTTVEVFSTRRSRFKPRKLKSPRGELDKAERRKEGSINCEAEVSELEISGSLPPASNVESADKVVLPDLLILLECFRGISGHRFAPLFKLRPEIQSDARYRGLIKRHMDLNTVRTKLEEGTYSESLEFFRDMMLIFSNALVFYSRDSQEYGAARILREDLIREMELHLKEESPHKSSASTQAVECSESEGVQDSSVSCSVTAYSSKRQASAKSSYGPGLGFLGDDGASEVSLDTRVTAQDWGLGKRKFAKDLAVKKKDQGDIAQSKAFVKTKAARTRVPAAQVDRSNIEKFEMEHSRIPENTVANLSKKTEKAISSQVLRSSHQASSRTFRGYIPRKDSFDKGRSSRYSSERPGSSLHERRGEPSRSLGGGQSSRSAQRSKQTHSRDIQSYSQAQKRKRTLS